MCASRIFVSWVRSTDPHQSPIWIQTALNFKGGPLTSSCPRKSLVPGRVQLPIRTVLVAPSRVQPRVGSRPGRIGRTLGGRAPSGQSDQWL